MVGLSGTGRKKAARFSLGMKQRLSIAMALLHEPSLLILDEPTNGLDPNGMVEIRAMLLELNRNHGTTIVISSHLLAEIEKMVSHIGIIHAGRLLFQGTLAELQQRRSSGHRLNLLTDDPERAAEILADMNLEARIMGGRISLMQPERESVAALAKKLIESGINLYELTPSGNDLEAIFMEMITV
jgi:ABC-2 type transport system ATP-binding protein